MMDCEDCGTKDLACHGLPAEANVRWCGRCAKAHEGAVHIDLRHAHPNPAPKSGKRKDAGAGDGPPSKKKTRGPGKKTLMNAEHQTGLERNGLPGHIELRVRAGAEFAQQTLMTCWYHAVARDGVARDAA